MQAPKHPPRHPSGRGIDLERWYLDVRRLTLSKVGRSARAAGLDVEDVVSEVCRRILVANQGRSPYNPARGPFGHYVKMQARAALLNLVEKRDYRLRFEEVGYHAPEGGVMDAALAPIEAEGDFNAATSARALMSSEEGVRALLMVADGEREADVEAATGICVRRHLPANLPPPSLADRLYREIVEHGPSTAAELAERVGESASRVSNLLRRTPGVRREGRHFHLATDEP